jgi:hypothetical protein
MNVAVRRGQEKAGDGRLKEYLAAHPEWTVTSFEPKDDDELNEKLCAAAFSKVVFLDLDAVLQMLWKGHADLGAWASVGVGIEICSLPGGDWRETLRQVHASIEAWRRIQRRRQIVAASILSAIILAAIAMLFALLGPAK